MIQEFFELVFVLIVFVGVLLLAYWATKKLGSMNRKMSFNKNMEIIEVLPLMQGHYLYIVKVRNRYFLMGCSQKGSMTYINELDAQQIKCGEEKVTSFQEQFMHFMKGRQVKEDENKEQK